MTATDLRGASPGCRERSARRVVAAILGLVAVATACLGQPRGARARELWSSDDLEHSLSLDSAFKTTWLLSHAPDDPLLFPERDTETGLLRLRLSLAGTFGPHVDSRVSYEHRARMQSDPGGLGAVALLPPTAPAPFRIRPVQATILDRPAVTHVHEVDRAWVALHLQPVELTLGRQAIGLGRGVLFSAVDVLSPFSPLEVDREWRRGVDAARAELSLGEHLSAGAIGAANRDFDGGVLLGRLRGYAGPLDGELLAGKRDADTMLGVAASATLGDAELHAEGAGFRTDGRGIEAGLLGSERWVGKALLGSSYRFDVGRGLNVLGEYHYSGFGLRDIGSDASLLLDPAFTDRFSRGDSQILGRHVAALVMTLDLTDSLTGNLAGLVSPVDSSGLVAPTLTFIPSDNVTVIASGYVPWGKAPRMGRIRSEYGLGGPSALLQVRLYD